MPKVAGTWEDSLSRCVEHHGNECKPLAAVHAEARKGPLHPVQVGPVLFCGTALTMMDASFSRAKKGPMVAHALTAASPRFRAASRSCEHQMSSLVDCNCQPGTPQDVLVYASLQSHQAAAFHSVPLSAAVLQAISPAMLAASA
jgi:hypothetical protein